MKNCWQMEPKERPPFPLLQQMLAKNFGKFSREREGEEGGRERGEGEGEGGGGEERERESQ